MKERLRLIDDRYRKIGELLGDVNGNITKTAELMKEMRKLEKTVTLYHRYLDAEKERDEIKELMKDPDLKELASDELEEKEKILKETEEKLKILLLPEDPDDSKNVIMEIRGAAGGDEANIFAGDLYRMYSRYFETKGWKTEILNAFESEMGGFSRIEFMVKGEKVYSFLKYESGAHRVQRVPVTESMGRIHTSTATVLVMPEAGEFDFKLNMDDVRVDTYCSSGHGGQSVNTTKSAIRVTHIPTGIIATCQDGKDQHENKANALKVLQARLYDAMLREREAKEEAERISKIGHGDRSEKIRTYNYPQNRVTDHRIGFTVQQLDRIMEGKIDIVIDALIEADRKMKLAGNDK